jgi:glycosyltransferase involved in cell wall biosynthesis
MRPKATLVWLNYNSSGFLGLALRSLNSLLQLDYDDYEVIIVDNASNDGSFEAIKKFVEGHGIWQGQDQGRQERREQGLLRGNELGLESARPRVQVRGLPQQRSNR